MLALPYETTAQQELRANCITTIGCIIESVKDKPEICLRDAHEISAILVGLLYSGKIDEADAQEVAIKGTLVQLAGCLKHEFKEYLGPLISALIRDMKKDLDFKIVDADQAELEE